MNIKGILLDIEGTTSSISFVYDEMFPYIRRELVGFVSKNWEDESVQSCVPLLAADLGYSSVDDWPGFEDSPQSCFTDGIIKLMDDDVKATGLKQLQGLIWKDGFHSGQLVAHLFDDVAPAIKAWVGSGLDVRIYSSGSIAAQKLFFGHTIAGDLLEQFQGHYDTTTGPKKESASYESIAKEFGLPANEILFVSDVAEELDAASNAGMETALSIRPGNKPVPETASFVQITSFAQLELSVPSK